MTHSQSEEYCKLLDYGSPPNVKKCFPNSKALIVSGKYIDRAMLAKGNCMTIAANGRNAFVIKGTLAAAQRANAAVIIEIARSEGGTGAYYATSLWNIARQTDAYMNEMGITVPVAIHADHFGIKKPEDVEPAKTEIRSLFDTGITSIAFDASHMPDDQNLLANIELNPYVPEWAGLKTEVGEIKGEQGLSTAEEALFLIQGLNAHSIFPDWIALNNGTSHFKRYFTGDQMREVALAYKQFLLYLNHGIKTVEYLMEGSLVNRTYYVANSENHVSSLANRMNYPTTLRRVAQVSLSVLGKMSKIISSFPKRLRKKTFQFKKISPTLKNQHSYSQVLLYS
ncbi:class II fructose-bisphosphate aldolase [uncultured Desulfobacter sp.]|uniref:class II fructose-bisphosphate aldolase n=1 Tax=uncultured Desulfobacter sp. TaxID=240139 RepID=UPI002AA91BA8|nr:class II fructose-bisphosphate aldolase [uncultured Desulfobacter sp.]